VEINANIEFTIDSKNFIKLPSPGINEIAFVKLDRRPDSPPKFWRTDERLLRPGIADSIFVIPDKDGFVDINDVKSGSDVGNTDPELEADPKFGRTDANDDTPDGKTDPRFGTTDPTFGTTDVKVDRPGSDGNTDPKLGKMDDMFGSPDRMFPNGVPPRS